MKIAIDPSNDIFVGSGFFRAAIGPPLILKGC